MASKLWLDVRYAARRMRQAPLFSSAIVLTLALAIGATTAIFSVVDTVLLRALPYRDTDRLVILYQSIGKAGALPPAGFSAPDHYAFQQRTTSFESIAAFRNREYELSGVSEPERIVAARVSWTLFSTLGVDPAFGRAFSREEDEGQRPVVILSDRLWRRKFAADTGVVGRAVVLERRPYTIVGVMPRGFVFPNRGPIMNNVPAELYLPISFTPVERGRQTLVESAVLATTGGILSLAIARWVVAALAASAPDTLPRVEEVGLDLRVLGFTALLAGATAILFGLIPALEVTRTEPSGVLKEGGRSGAMGSRQRRIFSTLVATQFALAAVVLVGGGLLLRSFNKLMNVDPGFKAEHVLTLATSLPASAYPNGSDVRSFYTRLLPNLAALPGVSAVSASTDLPLGIRERRAFTIEFEPETAKGLPFSVAHDWVAGRYFETLGIALKRGRYLSEQDTQTSERVVVINETMARRFWRDADPVGQQIAWGNPQSHAPWMRIVGVVADVKQGPLQSEIVPQTFSPWLQVNDSMLGNNIVGQFRSMKISVRTENDPVLLAAAVQAQIRGLDASLPITAVRTLEEVVQRSAAPQRFNTVLLGAFGLLALLLAALGIGGVLATSVSRRTQELGIRMALGARRGMLLRMVLREGITLALLGLAVGIPAALALTRLMSTLLFEISPRDPLTFAAVIMLLLAVALLASYIPARRATGIDPMAALRRE